MWRIHFTNTDLTRVRLADGPNPRLELVESVRMAGSRSERSTVFFGRWRQRIRGALTHLPRSAAAQNLTSFQDPAIRAYFGTALAPYWPHIHRQVGHHLHRHARDLAAGGTHELLGRASPHLTWDHPVLVAGTGGARREIHLDGRGLVLQPSFFADDVSLLCEPGTDVILAYPIPVQPGWCAAAGEQRDLPLDRLLGATRARALEALAREALGTSQLAARLQISLPAASLQAKVLRDSGLVVSEHQGKRVIHHATALGVELVLGIGRLSTA